MYHPRMTTQEIHYTLKWNDFETNVSKSFANLRTETQLFDVTLVGQDQKKVSAHRLVLSACSDFFKNIFYSNIHSHPMLYLDGVDSTDINLLLDYIYQGEVQIHQEGIDRFLEVASKFKLEGLMGTETDIKDPESPNNITKDFGEEEEWLKEPAEAGKCAITKMNTPKSINERTIRTFQNPQQLINASNSDVDEKFKELIAKEEGYLRCTVCEKTMVHQGSMKRHLETHLTGLSYNCQHCGDTFRSRNTLKHHNFLKHKTFLNSFSSRKRLADHKFTKIHN